MKNLLFRFFGIVTLFFLWSTPNRAQTMKKWEFGLSSQYGKDFYTRSYFPNQSVRSVPGNIRFRSNFSFGIGLLTERRFSGISWINQINYIASDVSPNTICDCSYSGSVWLQAEKHHMATIGTGARWYIIDKPVKPFLEIGIQENWFIGYTDRRDDKKVFYADAAGYGRFFPSALGAVGVRFGKVSILGQCHTDIGNSFKRNDGLASNGVDYAVKSALVRQSFSFKATYLFISN